MEHDEENDPIVRRQEGFRCQWLRVDGQIGHIKYYFNPLIACSVFVVVWSIIIWAFVDSNSKDRVDEAKKWITATWTWLYVAEQFIWAGMVIFIYFRWGHLKLGRDEDKPEHTDFSYFAMIFCTGLSAAKYYAGVSEPIDHYEFSGQNHTLGYWGKDGHTQNAQNAINLTLFHWGIHGYAINTLPAIAMSFLAYRKGLPVTMRTCLYPLIGHKIYGRVGDVIDILSATMLVFGVSIGLTIGAELIITGIHEWFPEVDTSSENRIILIWSLTLIATLSVVSGIGLGLKHLSSLTFAVGLCVWLVIIFIDDTAYLLNVFVQSVGYYIQNLIGTGLHTGAHAQKGNLPMQQQESKDWMNENTLFYWGWWIVTAPLSATFITRISRGRRISELIMYSCFLPTLCLFAWFTTFGGIALNMQHNAINENIICQDMYNNQLKIRNPSHVRWEQLDGKYKSIDNLFCLRRSARFFAVIQQYDGVSKVLYVLTMFSMMLQFITHADSASLVVDIISSNGKDDPPIAQRGLWALIQGATATAFVYYADIDKHEGSDSVQAIAVVAAIPLIVIFNCCAVGIWRMLRKEGEFQIDTEFIEWRMYYGNINSKRLFINMLISILFPWLFLGKIVIKEKHCKHFRSKLFAYLSFAVPFYLWIVLLITQIAVTDLDKFGWVSLLVFFAYAAKYRQILRRKRDLVGSLIGDFFIMMVYPLSVVQMYEESENVVEIKPVEPEEIEFQIYDNNRSVSSPYYEPGVTPDVERREINGQSVQQPASIISKDSVSNVGNGHTNYIYEPGETPDVERREIEKQPVQHSNYIDVPGETPDVERREIDRQPVQQPVSITSEDSVSNVGNGHTNYIYEPGETPDVERREIDRQPVQQPVSITSEDSVSNVGNGHTNYVYAESNVGSTFYA